MPALPAASKVLQITTFLTIGIDNAALNRFFMSYSGTAPTDPDLIELSEDVATDWSANLAPLASGEVAFTGCKIIDLSSATSAIGESFQTVNGTRAGTPLDAATCAVIQEKIARRYRGGHPRVYFPGGVEGDLVDPQKWSDGFLTAMSAAWEAFIVAVVADVWSAGGTLDPVNVSYYEGFTVVVNPITGRARNVPTVRAVPVVDPITNWKLNTNPGSQRRRNLKGS